MFICITFYFKIEVILQTTIIINYHLLLICCSNKLSFISTANFLRCMAYFFNTRSSCTQKFQAINIRKLFVGRKYALYGKSDVISKFQNHLRHHHNFFVKFLICMLTHIALSSSNSLDRYRTRLKLNWTWSMNNCSHKFSYDTCTNELRFYVYSEIPSLTLAFMLSFD